MKVQDVTRLLSLERLKRHIIQSSIVAWENKLSPSALDKWLENFTGQALNDKAAEQAIAAWLMLNFTYYSKAEVYELCRIIYRKYIHKKLREESYLKSGDSITEKVQRILERTIFVPLGNPSESGALILYDFRTANSLPKDLFNQHANLNEKLNDGSIDDIVLIDDVTLSGSQSIDYIGDLSLGNVNATLLTFFATPEAIRNLKSSAPQLAPVYASLLDNRTKLFSDESSAFSNEDTVQIKELALQLCNHYGKHVVENELSNAEAYMKSFPLGFADGQQLFGFYYNTPDNTLPIFWCNSANWSPAFIRYGKIYDVKGVAIQDEQYW